MELLSNVGKKVALKKWETDESTNDQQLTEAELCKPYGYELALSPAETNMPDDDQSWVSEDSTKSQSTGLKMATEDFDLLEPFLFYSEPSRKRPGKVSELYWFSDDSNDSRSSVVRACTGEFDQLESTLFSSIEPAVPVIDLTEDVDSEQDEGKSNDLANSHSDQQVSSEKYIAETMILVKAIVKKLTLGQKMKFYGWFNSGLSIEEAALKSKIPDLIPPPSRHPGCKLSKKRLRRLSKILPNVFMRRQFVNQVYFVGVDPKQMMRYLLMDWGSENLMTTFECQFALEEYAAARDKKLRHDKRERAAAAPAPVKELSNPDHEFGVKELKSGVDPMRANGCKMKNQTAENSLWKENMRDGSDAAVDALATVKQPPKSDLKANCREQNPKIHLRKPNYCRLNGDEQGLLVHVAASRVKTRIGEVVAEAIETSANAERPTEKSTGKPDPQMSKRCSIKGRQSSEDGSQHKADNKNRGSNCFKSDSKQRVDPGQQTQSTSGQSKTPCMSLKQLKKYYMWRNQSFSHSEALVKAQAPGLKPESVPHPSCKHSWEEVKEMSDTITKKHKRLMFQIEVFYGGKKPEDVMKKILSSYEKDALSNPESTADLLDTREIDSRRAFEKNDNSVFDQTFQELGNRCLKKYYAWRNSGLPHDAAFSKALSKHLDPRTREGSRFYVKHPKCEYSRGEVMKMSLELPERWARERFFTHVVFGGMDPAHALKSLRHTPVPNAGLSLSKSEQKLMKTVQMKYLMGKGLNRGDALNMMRNPSKKLINELKEVINLYCVKANENCLSLSEGAESSKIPLISPCHPSKLFSDDQLKKYYLWISEGFSRGNAFKKVMNDEPISQDMLESHYLRSKYDLEEVKKMSKNIMNEAGANLFIIEVFYGQTDPEDVMEFMSHPVKSVKACQDVRRDKAGTPWGLSDPVEDEGLNPLCSSEVPSAMAPELVDSLSFPAPSLQHQLVCPERSSTGVAETPTLLSQGTATDLSAMADSRYPQPGDVCSPIDQQYINSSVLETPNQTQASSTEQPIGQNTTLENNQVQCFIVPVDYPNEILSETQMDAIENSVLEAILEMDNDDTKPSFRDSFRSDGGYSIICNDEFSVNWLYKYLRVYEPWEGALLQLITNQSNKMRANAVLPLCQGDDDEKILKFIGKQNFGLNVENWTVSQRWDSSDGTYMDLVIDEESAEILLKSSRISFKLGTAEIITAQKDSSSRVTASPTNPLTSPPPLPSSPPPASPPPPPPSPQPPPKPCTIDTSLGALLRSTALKSYQERSQKIRINSTERYWRSSSSSSPEISGRRRSTRDQSSREQKRSRSSSLDHCAQIPRNSSHRTCKKRRAAPRSTSRDHEKKRRKCKKKDHSGSKSPSSERSGFIGEKKHSWLDWFYTGGRKRSSERFLTNPKQTPPQSRTTCSFISSVDNLSLADDPSPPISLENTEYAEYLGNSVSEPSSGVPVDMIDST